MSKEIIAAIIGFCALFLATIFKGCFDVWIQHVALKDTARKEAAAEIERLEAKVDKLTKDYWELYERHVLETIGVIGNREEVDNHLRAFRLYRATVIDKLPDTITDGKLPYNEPERKSYLEVGDSAKDKL